MARIVINTWGSYGDVYPYVGLALALRARGHEPVLAMPEVYRTLVEREGLAFRGVRPGLDVTDRALAARAMHPSRGPESLFREILAPAVAEAHADLSALVGPDDLLVSHPAALAAPIVAQERGLRWASSVLAPMSFFSVTDPITPPPAPWMHALLARSTVLSRWAVAFTRMVTARWAAPVTRFRRSRGLPAGANPVIEGQHSPHLVLALFSRVLATPQPDWPASVCVTGPVLYNASSHTPLPADLAAFLDEGEAPIVFTLGTSAVAAPGTFYEVSATVAARLGRRAVLLVGPHADNRPRHIPRGVFVAEFAPHALLFARAAAIVHQGGAGTLHQGLASGHPMLVVPHSHDQPDNARRATALGVARTLYPSQYREPALMRELRALLDTPGYRRRAAEVAEIVRTEDGASRACEALERIETRAG